MPKIVVKSQYIPPMYYCPYVSSYSFLIYIYIYVATNTFSHLLRYIQKLMSDAEISSECAVYISNLSIYLFLVTNTFSCLLSWLQKYMSDAAEMTDEVAVYFSNLLLFIYMWLAINSFSHLPF